MALYAYISTVGRNLIDGSNINFTGLWSGSTSYQARDAADDGLGHKWIALVDNTNEPLPTVFDTTEYTTWAHLVLVSEGDVDTTEVNAGDWLNDVWAGTNYAGTLFGQLSDSLDSLTEYVDSVYDLAVAGTTAADSADMWGRTAFSIAVDGTNAAAVAQATADSALDIAISALNTAWAGTDAAAAAQLTADGKVSKTGDTMTGNLVVPNIQLSSGTVATSSALSGTMVYDFNGPAYQFTTVDQDVYVSGTNMASVREIHVVLQSTGTSRTITYDTNFSWYGSAPPSTIVGSNVLLDLTSTGNLASDVIGIALTQV